MVLTHALNSHSRFIALSLERIPALTTGLAGLYVIAGVRL